MQLRVNRLVRLQVSSLSLNTTLLLICLSLLDGTLSARIGQGQKRAEGWLVHWLGSVFVAGLITDFSLKFGKMTHYGFNSVRRRDFNY